MSGLDEGIKKFTQNVYPTMEKEFRTLESGQSPHTLLITCSDSRVSPSLFSQTRPGELFVIRNAGNIVPKPGTGELSSEATIQYAVDVLKVQRIVVCGHSHCGAVGGLLNLDSLESLPIIREWVLRSEAILEQLGTDDVDVTKAIELNALLQLEHLREHQCVADAIKDGRLSLEAWVYDFGAGNVKFLKQPELA